MKLVDEQFQKLREFADRKIISLYSVDDGNNTVGLDGIVAIWEHQSQGEGDKWYYAIEYSNGLVKYIFNPSSVLKQPLEKESK